MALWLIQMLSSQSIKLILTLFKIRKSISEPGSKLTRETMWITKFLLSGSRAVVATFFFPTISTCLVIEKLLAIVYNLYLNSQLIKLILILLKIRKNISKSTIMLKSANTKVSSKNWDFASLSSTKKSNHYTKSFKPATVHFLGTNVSLLNMRIKFFYKTWLHCVEFATKIGESFNQILAKLSKVPIIQDLFNLDDKLIWNHSKISLHTSHRYQRKGCWGWY